SATPSSAWNSGLCTPVFIHWCDPACTHRSHTRHDVEPSVPDQLRLAVDGHGRTRALTKPNIVMWKPIFNSSNAAMKRAPAELSVKSYNVLRHFSWLSLICIVGVFSVFSILLSKFLTDSFIYRDAVLTMEFLQSVEDVE